MNWLTEINNIGASLSFFVSLVALCVSIASLIFNVKSTNKERKISAKRHEEQKRDGVPYFVVDEDKFEVNQRCDAGVKEYRVVFKNIGKRPACKIEHKLICYATLDDSERKRIELSIKSVEKSDVEPGDSITIVWEKSDMYDNDIWEMEPEIIFRDPLDEDNIYYIEKFHIICRNLGKFGRVVTEKGGDRRLIKQKDDKTTV